MGTRLAAIPFNFKSGLGFQPELGTLGRASKSFHTQLVGKLEAYTIKVERLRLNESETSLNRTDLAAVAEKCQTVADFYVSLF